MSEARAAARPGTVDALAAELRRARAEHATVLACGRGTRMAMGPPLTGLGRGDGRGIPAPDLVLTTTALDRIVAYEPADLMVTVEAGCDRAVLESALAERGQCLPLQGVMGMSSGTIGGLLAAAPEGALALAHGGPRDRVTGLRVALADGSVVKGGGRVVKNVAGLPIHRLMLGSFGTLGVIVEASFKVHPKPEAEGTALVAFSTLSAAFEAARLVLSSGMEPVFVNVLAGRWETMVLVGFDGSAARVSAHLRSLVDLVRPSRPESLRVVEGAEQCALRDRKSVV